MTRSSGSDAEPRQFVKQRRRPRPRMNRRWAIFLLGLALVTASAILLLAAVALADVVAESGWINIAWVSAIAMGVVTPLISVVGAIGVASLYFELRSIKEGVGAQELAAVFD